MDAKKEDLILNIKDHTHLETSHEVSLLNSMTDDQLVLVENLLLRLQAVWSDKLDDLED